MGIRIRLDFKSVLTGKCADFEHLPISELHISISKLKYKLRVSTLYMKYDRKKKNVSVSAYVIHG